MAMMSVGFMLLFSRCHALPLFPINTHVCIYVHCNHSLPILWLPVVVFVLLQYYFAGYCTMQGDKLDSREQSCLAMCQDRYIDTRAQVQEAVGKRQNMG